MESRRGICIQAIAGMKVMGTKMRMCLARGKEQQDPKQILHETYILKNFVILFIDTQIIAGEERLQN